MGVKTGAKRLLAGLLCLVMALSVFDGTGLLAGQAYAAGPSATAAAGGTPGVEGRVADPDTMDTYQSALLSTESGSRYAGRVWSDKTVFASGDDTATHSHMTGEYTVGLDMEHDGYTGS